MSTAADLLVRDYHNGVMMISQALDDLIIIIIIHTIRSSLTDPIVMRAMRVMMIIGLIGLSDEHELSEITTTTTEIA